MMKISEKDRKEYLENREDFFELVDQVILEMADYTPTELLFALSDFNNGRLMLFLIGQYYAGVVDPHKIAMNIRRGYLPVQQWVQPIEDFNYFLQSILEGKLDPIAMARSCLVQMRMKEMSDEVTSFSTTIN